MANAAHNNLTGTDLHEPKGVASATADQVYVSDGAASGAWADILPQVAHYQYQESDGDSGESYATSWTKVSLNTEVSDPESIGSLASNQVTIGAGTWVFQGWAGARYDGSGGGQARIRIYNATDASVISLGQSWNLTNLSNLATPTNIHVFGQTVITGSKAIELQLIADSTQVKTGVHDSLSAGAEVYAELLVWKIKD